MKKKIISTMFLYTIVLGLCACGAEEDSINDSSKSESIEAAIEDNAVNDVSIDVIEEIVEENNVLVKESIDEELTFPNDLIGDCINFGTYEQDGDTSNGSEPIEWEVWDINENGVLLVSKYVLAAQKVSEDNWAIIDDGSTKTYVRLTWEYCELRQWLNNTFFNKAFSEDEQQLINTTHLVTSGSPYGEFNTEVETDDKVFILSVDELEKYCAYTQYDEGKHYGYSMDVIAEPTYSISKADLVYWCEFKWDEDWEHWERYGYTEDIDGLKGASYFTRTFVYYKDDMYKTQVSYVHASGEFGNSILDARVYSPSNMNGIRPAMYVKQ